MLNEVLRLTQGDLTSVTGTFKTAEEACYAYDKYVIENNLEHTTNGLYKKEIF